MVAVQLIVRYIVDLYNGGSLFRSALDSGYGVFMAAEPELSAESITEAGWG